ncbi:hypothetical protein ES288_D09G157000v1 [Gossypium darwinii]|uniref:Copia protein n=1 Tax=Gossypium darwinii TaxID=34276 RepID=A0A5D2BCM0_GOSDA|nr:hypothetical protein ES288_D09G157000v1 [Gossypium darwinii]
MSVSKVPIIWCDNSSMVSVTENPTHHTKMKHVEIDHHFVREKILAGSLQVNLVPSTQQIADVLTKPITPKLFSNFRHALRVLTSKEFCNSKDKQAEGMLE